MRFFCTIWFLFYCFSTMHMIYVKFNFFLGIYPLIKRAQSLSRWSDKKQKLSSFILQSYCFTASQLQNKFPVYSKWRENSYEGNVVNVVSLLQHPILFSNQQWLFELKKQSALFNMPCTI